MKELHVKIRQRYNEASTWTRINPILESGEIGIESNTGKFKCGDGRRRWIELDYAAGDGFECLFSNTVDDMPDANEHPWEIIIVPREYEDVPIIGKDGKPTGETESFTMDTPYISLRKNGIYYWTVFSDQLNVPIASSALDYFQLDLSTLG